MKTLFGTTVDPSTMGGVVYLCKYEGKKLTPVKELIFKESWQAMEAYANIPNPASQIASRTKQKTLEENLEILHKNMADPEWQEQLADYL